MGRRKTPIGGDVWEVDPNAPRENCFLCRHDFQFGRGRYMGHFAGDWGIYLCKVCADANWDGIVPMSYEKLHEHFAINKITPKLNSKGWIVVPGLSSSDY